MSDLDDVKSIAYILIDFDNFFSYGLDFERLKTEINYLCSVFIEKISNDIKEIKEIHFKFYGGWYIKGVLTQRASELASIVYDIGISFSVIKNNSMIRCYLDMVKTMLDYDDFVFDNTLKEKEGLPRIRISKSIDLSICNVNSHNCPVKIINKFTAKPDKLCSISNCNHLNRSVFSAPQQKMVDTLIACDIISIALKDDSHYMCLLSEDIDCVPPLLLASRLCAGKLLSIEIMCKRNNAFASFLNIFSDNKIQIQAWT